ncbi:flavodoxin domain-containing protein [Konateibacter massiliensis]|uniref:flavodoxin domain-containing protein n=1 Tax=Konateibacter massiliensis TaxID=2002841 RepID=UPI000C153FC5|nr:flavodoxin domain-containing protein [Konateibacter massiliensis]
MKKIAVIYKSKYGFTKTYAQWISDELKADLLEADKTKPAALQEYDVIVYGGGLYAGGVSGISLITKNFASINSKAIFLFTVGAADVADRQNTDSIRKSLARVLTPEMQEKIKIYHLRGGMDYANMSFMHRTMMGMMMKMLHKKSESELTSEEKSMIETYGQKVDFTDRSTITPLVQAIKAATEAH